MTTKPTEPVDDTDDTQQDRELTYEFLRELVREMFEDLPGQKPDVKGPIVTGELD